MSLYATTRTITLVLRGVNRLSPVVKEAAADIGLLEKVQKKVSDASYRLLFAGAAIAAFSFIATRGLMRVVAASEAGVFVAKDYENVLKRLADIMGRHLAPFAAFLVRQLHALAEVFEKHPVVARWVAGLWILAVVLGLIVVPLILVVMGVKMFGQFLGLLLAPFAQVIKFFKGLTPLASFLAKVLGVLALVILALVTFGVALYLNIWNLQERFKEFLIWLGFTDVEVKRIIMVFMNLGKTVVEGAKRIWELIKAIMRSKTVTDALKATLRAIITVLSIFAAVIDVVLTGIRWTIEAILEWIYHLTGGSLDDALQRIISLVRELIGWVQQLISWLNAIPRTIDIWIRRRGDGGGGGGDGGGGDGGGDGDGDGDGRGGGGIEGAPGQTIAEVMADWEAGRVEPGTYGAYGLQRGIDFVPYTGTYRLHRGEKVIPAEERGGPSSMSIPIRIDNLNTKADKDELGTLISRAVANELLKLRSTRGLA